MRRILRRRPSPAMAVALVALFVAMSGVAYAANTIHSRDIVNDAVTTADIQGGGGRTGTIKNRDTNALLAIPKGYASIDAGHLAARPQLRRPADLDLVGRFGRSRVYTACTTSRSTRTPGPAGS